MIRLKQPTLLELMAFEVLIEHLVKCCHEHSVKNSLYELNQSIIFIKENVCKRLPWQLVMNFCGKFLDKFYTKTRPASHNRAVLKLLMDTKIVGLRCEGQILADLDPSDACRFRGLKELNLEQTFSRIHHFRDFPASVTEFIRILHLYQNCKEPITKYFSNTVPIKLENFPLQDLTTIIFGCFCTDLNLITIGKNCPNLQVLKIRGSRAVTDEGLGALNSCSEIRVLDIVRCQVTHIGINGLLTVHKKLEELAHGDCVWFRGRDVLAHLDSSICTSMNCIFIESNAISSVPLQSLVVKFPNLTYLTIDGPFTGELTTLKFLKNLTGLELVHINCNNMFGRSNDIVTLTNLMELLKIIGGKLTDLKIAQNGESFYLNQINLNLILNFCPSIEWLECDIRTLSELILSCRIRGNY